MWQNRETDLFIDPAIEQGSLHCLSLVAPDNSGPHRVVVREDGAILCHNVKQVHPAGFYGLGDVVIG